MYSSHVRIGRRADPLVCPRTHMFLLVTIDGRRYLADVAVGAVSPSGALLLDTSIPEQVLLLAKPLCQPFF